jgi:O-acetyl-ADP-ribose deacetylase (regulator of RNase III)
VIEIVSGDLLEAKEQYIAHQANCVSTTWSGIAKSIFDKYPYANTYQNRVIPHQLGTISIHGDVDERKIINMYGQYYPGPPIEPNNPGRILTKTYYHPDIVDDSKEVRQKAFYNCLLKIARLPDLKSIAFPFRIGAGLAAGDWEYYLGSINNFAKFVEEKYDAKVSIYQREEDK